MAQIQQGLFPIESPLLKTNSSISIQILLKVV